MTEQGGLTHVCQDLLAQTESWKETTSEMIHPLWIPGSHAPPSMEPGHIPWRSPDFHHELLLPSLIGLTKTQETEEFGGHGAASVRQEAELSKADKFTGCAGQGPHTTVCTVHKVPVTQEGDQLLLTLRMVLRI